MNDRFVELFVEEMNKLGFKRVPVGPGQLKAMALKKARGRTKRSVARGSPAEKRRSNRRS